MQIHIDFKFTIVYYTQYKVTSYIVFIGGGGLDTHALMDSLLVELRRGTLTLAVLSQLQTPQYGYSLVQLLESSGIPIDQNTLYPLLRRLEKQQLVTSSWDTSEARPRKYYELSAQGKPVLLQLKEEWIRSSRRLYRLLEGDDFDGLD